MRSGQKDILKSIAEVRTQLKEADARQASMALEITPILARLGVLYSLLDVDALAEMVAPEAQVIDLAQYREQKKAA